MSLNRTNYFRKAYVVMGIAVCAIGLRAGAASSSLPESVATAHTIYIENRTGFPELQYTAILELNKWGQYQEAESREKADLLMLLSSGTKVQAVPDGQGPRTSGMNAFVEDTVPRGHTRIALLDPKTGSTLWSDLRKTEGGKVKGGHLLDGLREAYEDYQKNRGKR